MPTESPREKGPDEKFCSNCGETIDKDAEICPACGVRQQEPNLFPSDKSPAIAAVLSFVIVGLGQVYNGQILKGIAFHIGMWFAVIFGVLFFWLIFPILIPFGLWLFNVYDAYDQAQKLNLRQHQPL